jgi:CTP:molybdopterin cytidylyltransferase MocA
MTCPAGCELNLTRPYAAPCARAIDLRGFSYNGEPDHRVHTVHMSKSGIAAGVLLAAGAGTRYGMPKVLARNGQWLRAGVTALADGGCDDVVVVLGAAIVDVPAPARAVVARDWEQGLSASVRAGIQAIGAASGAAIEAAIEEPIEEAVAGAIEAAFAVLHTVDAPGVGAAVVHRVLDAARSSPSGLARARYGDRPGHPVVIARRHWADLLDGLRGDEGARAFLARRADVVAVDCADLASGQDIDTVTP